MVKYVLYVELNRFFFGGIPYMRNQFLRSFLHLNLLDYQAIKIKKKYRKATAELIYCNAPKLPPEREV
jgi:hypothetical protein